MNFDPVNNTAKCAALVERSDDRSFTIEALSTVNYVAGHEYQSSFPVHPLKPRLAITWRARYRGLQRAGLPLIVDQTQKDIGYAAALDSAAKTFDELDLRASGDGANPNPLAPS